MPVKSGIKAMKEIRKINENAKIIITSANKNIKEKALASGALHFLKKPIGFNDIIKAVRSFLNVKVA